MACKSCEERREWMRVQYERAKERMRLCIERLTGSADRTKQPANQAEQPTDSDQQRTERTDQ